MKGKAIRFVLGMILILSLYLTTALPVAAKSPNVLGYISGSSCIGSDIKQPCFITGGKITLLADGAIAGYWSMHFFKSYDEESIGLDPDVLADTKWTCDELIGVEFIRANMGWFYGWFTPNNKKKSKFTEPLPIIIAVKDMGEPGVNNDMIYIGLNAPPTIIEHGNFQVWASDEYFTQ
jgi:hypothetical protein